MLEGSLTAERVARVALIGAPNSGKTTLFNWLTGSRFRTVNYPGSTVEYSVGETLQNLGPNLTVMDTPGTYSLSPKSPEEEVTWAALFKPQLTEKPDAIIAVVDATQMPRHLLIVDQIRKAGFLVVVALTMADLLKKQGITVDLSALEKQWGFAFVLVDGRLGGGVKELVERTTSLSKSTKTIHPPLPRSASEIEEAAKAVQLQLEKILHKGSGGGRDPGLTTHLLDRFLLHPYLGLAIFAISMATLFTAIFWVAQPIMGFIDDQIGSVAEFVLNLAPDQLWAQFLSNGVISSFGAILVFTPQIFILFAGLTLFEDSGYLARAATLIDKPLSKIGLNGRAFTAILSGYACAIPAMMAARTISNRRERMLTLFILPLMSCSARIPVYALLLGFLLRGQPSWVSGVALTVIYLASMVLGALAAVVAGRFLPKDLKSFFILELPLYRRPHVRTVLRTAFTRTKSFVTRAGPTIFVISALIWAATTFPNYQLEDKTERVSQSYAAHLGHILEPVMKPMGGDWRVGVGLISAFLAREVFVSSMAIIFHVTETDDEAALSESVLSSMREAKNPDGSLLFTTASIVGLVIFFMIALQCAATVSVASRESGMWKFALVQLAVFNGAAYLLSVGAVQSLHLLGVP